MPDYRFHFAWVDPEDSTFIQDYKRSDEHILAFKLSHKEGDFATLSITFKNPMTPVLAPDRKPCAWFSYSMDGGPAIPRFFGRVVAVPTGIFGSTISYDLTARPADVIAQKEALAATMRTLPQWDEIFIDESHRDDVDEVLQGHAALWYFDPVTHEVSTSHALTGEDGVVEFLASQMHFNGLDVRLDSPPLLSVKVSAKLPWTQLAQGTVDLSRYIIDNWPNESFYPNVITSFTMTPDNWPTTGSALKDGWNVNFGQAVERYDLTVRSRSATVEHRMAWPAFQVKPNSPVSAGVKVTRQTSDDYLTIVPPGSISLPSILTQNDTNVQYDKASSVETGFDVQFTETWVNSFTINRAWTATVIPLHHLSVGLIVGYDAERPMTETVTFTLTADMQPIITAPGDEDFETLTFNAVNLSEMIGTGTDAEAPIGDTRRRSYVNTPRGEQSIQYLICRAKAHLLWRCGATVEFRPLFFHDMDGVTLQKNALIHEDRIPSGEALGKVTEWSQEFANGVISNIVLMRSALGRGGEVEEVAGLPDYVEDDYIGPEEDWQEYIGRTILVPGIPDVGYTQPAFAPNDDGLDFFGELQVEDILEEEATVDNPPASQRTHINEALDAWDRTLQPQVGGGLGETIVQARSDAIKAVLDDIPSAILFSLKPVNSTFETPVALTVTQLKVPNMLSLESETA